nr:helicase-related protein [uncultured Capnocytophaga sp.]
MLVDNHSTEFKVHSFIQQYINDGSMDIVTGYFTVGALCHFANLTNEKIAQYRIILGDITQRDVTEISSLDLLNSDLSLEKALRLKSLAKEAVDFLQLSKVSLKTLEPNFCHAKLYLFKSEKNDRQKNFYISGSSNLTEAGIGIKQSDNFELNIADFGGNEQYKEILNWFNALWEHPKAHNFKILVDENGKETKIDFKTYLINEISKLFQEFLPNDIYFKILFERFYNDISLSINTPEYQRNIQKLKDSEIYNALYEFQQKGAESLINRIEKYNGAILADAVGLGKTWTALAVMKYFQNRGREILLLCPKKLHYNWLKYKKNQNSRFEKDELEYHIRFHTDLDEKLMQKPEYVHDRKDYNFTNKKPKLIVIDESHNLRNDKSKRFEYLLEEIIKKNEDVKVLLLSATPINTDFKDVRNQLKLITKGDNTALKNILDINNLDYLFKQTSTLYNKWQLNKEASISQLTQAFGQDFFKLTDSLIIARTRKMIVHQQRNLVFPTKAKPINKYITPKIMLEASTLTDLINMFPPYLAGYQPNYYTLTAEERRQRDIDYQNKTYNKDVLNDEIQRDKFLVKMMTILLLKRLESSWYSFHSTVNNILDNHRNTLIKLQRYKEIKTDDKITAFLTNIPEEEDEYQEFTLGKREIKLADIDKAGSLDDFEKDLLADVESLESLSDGMDNFARIIKKEERNTNKTKSNDTKLQELIAILNDKKENATNKKVIIFTTYTDTAQYLFEQLSARGFSKIAMINGNGAQTDYEGETHIPNFEGVLERFAPFTKLFVERKWEDFECDAESPQERYTLWQEWVVSVDKKVQQQLDTPIDILIATDALSEGQNLQDADMVINYDIHWNPVRTIQRVGRIDRLGSPNQEVFTVNFWPAPNINEYLNLQTRIEKRMAAMKIIGSEDIKDFTENYANIAIDTDLEERQNKKMLEQMQDSIEELETEKSFGFDDLSLEMYRQDLALELENRLNYYLQLPNGIFSGVAFAEAIENEQKEGIIALLGSPIRKAKQKKAYQQLKLVYVDTQGKEILINEKEILHYLSQQKNAPRYGCEKLDIGDPEEVKHYANALAQWFEHQQANTIVDEEGNEQKVASTQSVNLLKNMLKGKKEAIKEVKTNEKASEKFDKNNWNLITWLIVKK